MLEARGISVSFGGVRAVRDVSVDVAAQEIVGLVGPNGSGKTTLLNALTGVIDASGSLRYGGRALPLGRPERVRRAGLLRMFQTPQTFTELTCIENVLLSAPDRGMTGLAGAWALRPLMWRRERRRWADALAALDRVGLRRRATALASVLTFGEQRLLDLARSMAGRPSLLMLDEPSAGLNEGETAELARLVREVRDEGAAILVIDHKIDFIDALCDRVVVLELGQVIAEGRPEHVWRDQRVVDAYLGVARGA